MGFTIDGTIRKEIAKHGEIIKAEFDIFALRKHKGSTGGLQSTTNANPVIQTKISSLTERKTISFPETER